MGWLHRLDRLIGHIVGAAQWLALPLILLLFLQWPLRDIVRAYSREANNLGQIIFALFVAVSVTAATRAGTHLAADTLAQRYSARTRRWIKRIGTAVSVLPWALFVVPSVLERESFADTDNPGYFIIKAALWIMAIVVVAQSAIDVFRPSPADDV
ncbi:MAG: TRAP transporter small permease subunit [Pseudolabrys sp.]